jgi:hypothetical protein
MKPRRPDVPWPFPGDSELDKARRVARDYRTELMRVDPELCARMDDAARRLGQDWVTPQLALVDANTVITVAEAAEYMCLSESAIRKWMKDLPGRVKRLNVFVGDDGIQRVSVGQLMEIQREQRVRRIQRHTDRAS